MDKDVMCMFIVEYSSNKKNKNSEVCKSMYGPRVVSWVK